MANNRRGGRGKGRGRTSSRRSSGGQSIVSGMLAGTNGDLISQSGGRATTFQAINGSKQNKYGPGSTGGKSVGIGGWIPGLQYSIFNPQGDSANMKSARQKTPGVNMSTRGNMGPTNASVVMPKALGPKGFGGNYRLSNGY